MLNLAIISIVALAVLAFWARWGAGVMSLVNSMLVPADPAPLRVGIRRRTPRDGYEALLREAEWRDLEGEQLLRERLQEDDDVARAYLAQLEARSRKTV